MKIRLGTRGSKLALWQAEFTKDKLEKLGHEVELVIIKTKGDNIQHLGFDKIEGKGFFTKEIEDELLAGSIDLAVHSMKDMPTEQPDGLVLGAVSYREDPRDVLLISKAAYDLDQPLRLKAQSTVGTSSARRKAQLHHLHPDLSTADIRGNVPTRIEKLRSGQFDAIVLAHAGLTRLGIAPDDLHIVPLHPSEFVPAPAQGVLAYQCSADNIPVRQLLLDIHEADVARCTNVERGVLKMMDGGCHMPLGVYCYQDEAGTYHAYGTFSDAIDQPMRKVRISQSTVHGMAQRLFDQLNTPQS